MKWNDKFLFRWFKCNFQNYQNIWHTRLITLRTEVYQEMERVRTVGSAFVISLVILGGLGRREIAAAGFALWVDNQLTAGQLRFQRLAISGPPNVIIVLQIVALDAPSLPLVHDPRSRIRHFYWKENHSSLYTSQNEMWRNIILALI